MENIRITDKYVFFWGSELSNFYPCTIKWSSADGSIKKFTSSEQLFMYMKSLVFNDFEISKQILAAQTPKEAKKLGRKIRGFDEEKWGRFRESIMYLAVNNKFRQNDNLRDFLMNPEFDGKQFVEGSPYDTIWGIGLDWNDPLADDEKNWKGLNLLGKCLNKVRENMQN